MTNNFNLNLNFMKTYFIIFAVIFAAFLSGGCTAKKTFDYKVIIAPGADNSSATIADMNKTAWVISKRLVNFFNIPQESIKPEVTEKQISLTIINIDTIKSGLIKKVITDYSKLEFRETYENTEILGFLTNADNILKEIRTADTGAEFKEKNPLFGILKPMVSDKGDPLPSCMIGLVNEKDTAQVSRYLQMDQVKALFPGDIKFFWGAKPYRYDQSKSLYGLFAMRVTTPDRQAPLDGSAIISANSVTRSGNFGVKIGLTMDSAGAKNWAKITRENINRCIAVIYEGRVISYPRVMSEISGGKTEITGDFTPEEANDFVNILKSGELPFRLKIVQEQLIKRE
jgi:hypothetical protein